MTFDNFNPDCAELDDLKDFFEANCETRRKEAEAFYGEKFRGYHKAFQNTVLYVFCTIKARISRQNGDIRGAECYEGRGQYHYNLLPKRAKW